MKKSIFMILIVIIALSAFADFGWRNYRYTPPTRDYVPPMRGLYALRLLQECKEITLEGVVKDIIWIPDDPKIIVESDGKLYEVRFCPIWYLNIGVGDTVKIEGKLVVIGGKEYVIAEKVNDTEVTYFGFGRPTWLRDRGPGSLREVPGWLRD
ncbi:MAG TPA: hypothetical protein EYH25_01990, partial [Thermotoga sp.]|nr:hypothetical protein [Thermotoga sp.]